MSDYKYEQQHRSRNQRKNPKQKRHIIIVCVSVLVVSTICFLGGKIIAWSESMQSVKILPTSSTTQAAVSSQAESKPSSQKVDKTAWNLMLVNPWNKIPDNYVNTIKLTPLINGQSIDERAYPDLQKMMDACRAAGNSPMICSSFRSNETQTRLFNKEVQGCLAKGKSEQDAKVEAAKWVAIPGTSEHQLGLAVDIVSKENQSLDKSQEDTATQKWLMENSYKFGFILRYPTDKHNITGINYEPWHYRYVGKEAAEQIKNKNICLEEYLKNK